MKNQTQFLGSDQILRQRNQELMILNTIARAFNHSIDLDQALKTALAQVAELLGLHTGWIWLLEEETGASYLAAAQNLPPGLVKNPKLMEGSCYCLDTYRAGDMDGAANINVVTCSRLKKLVDGSGGLRYHASIPLYAQDKQLGVLNVASPDWRELTENDLRLLYTIGDLLSIAIERARLYARSTEFGAIEERNRLAREIHDTLAQGLTAILLKLETADALTEAGGELQTIGQAIKGALSLARANLEEVRRSVLDLRAIPLEGRRLTEALRSLAVQQQSKNNLKIDFQESGGTRPLPLRIETGLFRIAQEALNNIIQHADAKSAGLELVIHPEKVTLTISDDGRGFNPRQIPPDRFGLLGLSERARLLGGELHVESTPGAGTRIEVSVPL